jgi:phage N-6-adenine-methyltransferase
VNEIVRTCDVIPAGDLPTLIRRAASNLESAKTAAEILCAMEQASFAYDIAKRAARFEKAKGAHDNIVDSARQLQANALEIEAQAKVRLANEYDAAQARGEVQKPGGARTVIIPDANNERPATVTELGLSSKDIFEARQIRDAEEAEPGIVRRVLDERLEAGEEPTRTALERGVVFRTNFTGQTEWYTPSALIERARAVLGEIDVDPASNEFAQRTVKAATFYSKEDDGLSKPWQGRVWLNPPYSRGVIGQFVAKLCAERKAGRVEAAILLTHNHTETAWWQAAALGSHAICFPRARVKFESPRGDIGSPQQGQAIFYFGSDVDKFSQKFYDVGLIVAVRQAPAIDT